MMREAHHQSERGVDQFRKRGSGPIVPIFFARASMVQAASASAISLRLFLMP